MHTRAKLIKAGTQSDNATDAAFPVCILSPNPNHHKDEDRATLVAWGEAGGPIPDSNQVIDAPPSLDSTQSLDRNARSVRAQTICR